MLFYPKIPDTRGCPGGKCIGFTKYDGTNVHWDWSPENEWHAFGTRRDTFPMNTGGVAAFRVAHPGLEAMDAFGIIAGPLGSYLAERKKPVRVFTEVLGTNSFAGEHLKEEQQHAILIDVQNDDGTMMPPKEFIDVFGHFSFTARVIFKGTFSGQVIQDVNNGVYDVTEGVVFKGLKGNWMAKAKTATWEKRLADSR